MGRPQDALHKIRRATSRSTGWPEFLQLLDKPPPNDPSRYLLEKDLVVRLLRLQMQLLASVGLPLEAMQTYYELAGLEQLAPDDPVVAASHWRTYAAPLAACVWHVKGARAICHTARARSGKFPRAGAFAR
jgi:hypothetical protein